MKRKLSILCLLSVAFTCSLQAKKVYVKLNSDTEAWTHVTQDANNIIVTLESGVTSFNSILSNISADDVVWVAKGEYNNTGAINLNGDRANVQLYGGFKGDETTLEDRRLKDADGNGLVEPWEFEYITNFKGNLDETPSFRLLTMNTAGVIVDGLTLSDNLSSTDHAAGAFIKEGATLRNSIIRDISVIKAASSAINGAGTQIDSNGKIENCLIENCLNQNTDDESGSSYGGGANVSGANSHIINSVIRNNQCTSNKNALGGGLFVNNGPLIENCVIYNNYAAFRGGGVYVHSSNPPKLVNLTIVNNMGATAGGGIFCNRSNTSIYNCVVWGNVNQLENANNINLNQISYLETFAYNGEQGLGIWIEDKNNISDPVSVLLNPVNNYDETYPEGNIPLFVRPTSFASIGLPFLPETIEEIQKANWSLKDGSALIDKGVANFSNATVTYTISNRDILGNSRPYGSLFDIGAYEYSGTPTGIAPNQKGEALYTVIRTDNGVKVSGVENQAVMNIYNAVGALVKSAKVSDGQTVVLSQKGIYIITVSENGSSQTTKLIF